MTVEPWAVPGQAAAQREKTVQDQRIRAMEVRESQAVQVRGHPGRMGRQEHMDNQARIIRLGIRERHFLTPGTGAGALT